jgi:FixJ family two-component response regulator
LNELQQRLAMLTPREREVLSHVVSGKRNKQIANELGTAEKTIKIHRASLMKKMKAESLADLMKLTELLEVISSPLD